MEEYRTNKEMRKPRTFEAWQEIRRKAPHTYYLPRNQKKVIEDRVALGESFYDKKEGSDDDVFE